MFVLYGNSVENDVFAPHLSSEAEEIRDWDCIRENMVIYFPFWHKQQQTIIWWTYTAWIEIASFSIWEEEQVTARIELHFPSRTSCQSLYSWASCTQALMLIHYMLLVILLPIPWLHEWSVVAGKGYSCYYSFIWIFFCTYCKFHWFYLHFG